jgi:hypothetical protein
MNRFAVLFGVAMAVAGQCAFAKSRLTDPVKIARDCKSEVELFCKEVRPGGQRVKGCLKGRSAALSPACSAALKSTD